MTKILKETIYSRLEETVNSRGCRIISKKWKLDIYTMAKKYHDEMYSQVELEIPEQKYIDMCNCMKELYQMHAYVNEMKENNDRLKENLRYKGKLLIERFDELNIEKEKLKLPNINNEIKYFACLQSALENNLVNEKINVNMNVDTNNDNDKTDFVNVRLSKRTYIGNIDISFFILEICFFHKEILT